MKKINTLFKTIMVMMLCYTTSLYGQFQCVGTLYISLPPGDQYILFPEDLLSEGDLTGYTATLSQSEFTCEDLGPNSITLSIFENGEPVFSCTSNVIVEDKLNPVAICVASPTFELNADGVRLLTAEDINGGSYDNCGLVTLYITPFILNCESANPTSVTMTVTDGSGNTSYCITNVFWEPYPNPTPSLACNDQVTIELGIGEERTVTTDLFLEGGPYGCPFQYEVEIRENDIPRPAPVVTLDDTNKVLVVYITDLNTGSTCWGTLIVVLAPGCDPVFEICDTACRSAAIGDCASGHTDQDNVEWPCDIIIISDCETPSDSLTPDYLLAEGLAEPGDAYPEIIDESCYQLGTVYDDQVFYNPESTEIVRSWLIINWTTDQIWEYTQNILVMHQGIEICDILPWNAPLGDCASGHTDTDDVEWPANITINTNCVHPEDLAMNPEVNANDVEPTIYTDCGSVFPSFSDIVTVLTDTTFQVERTWEILAFNTGQLWSYVQLITVNADTDASTVCTMREGGDAIPDVELITGVTTDETGCYSFENPDGIIVTPVKDSPLEAGVTLLDKILLLEYVLGIRTLSPYQMIAADLSQNGIISTLDAVYLDQIINGTFVPTFEHNWKFINRSTQLPYADISNPLNAYKFIGVKMGDIDNSFTFSSPLPLQEIDLNITDEILNKKEVYQVPFYLGENKRILGFSAQIKNDSANIDFLIVTAPLLPGFDMQSHVIITPGLVTINYIVPEDFLVTGVAIPAGSELFNIQLKPQVNTILSESLSLESSHTNILKPSNNEDALALTFGWEDLIISSVLNPGQANKLQFYPNPAADMIYFRGFKAEDEGVVNIMDAAGRILSSDPLQPSLNLNTLENGMYYMSVKLNSGEIYTAPLLKIKP